MLNQVEKTIKEHNMIMKGEGVLCALSGGADSVALLLCLNKLREKIGFSLFACHLNHALRGELADRDENFSIKLCEKLNIPIITKTVDIYSLANGKNIEEFARDVRYKFFNEALEHFHADKIATAHNADDVLETMLINLTRGTALLGLCSIPYVRDNIIRPILAIKRMDIERYLERENQDFVTDHTNFENEYTRNKMRNLVIPLLRDINPSIDGVKTSNLLKNDLDFIEKTTEKLFTDKVKNGSINVKVLKENHIALSSRLILKMVHEKTGKSMSTAFVENAFSIIYGDNPSAQISIDENFVLAREYDYIKVGEKSTNNSFEYKLTLNEEVIINSLNIAISLKKYEEVYNTLTNSYFICGKINVEKLVVRSRKSGDSINLRHTKSLKKLMIDKKIPKDIRDSIPVIADDTGVICVIGLGLDINFKGKDYIITYKKLGNDNEK